MASKYLVGAMLILGAAVLFLLGASVHGQILARSCRLTSQDGTPDKLILSGDCSAIGADTGLNLRLSPDGDLITDPTGNDIFPVTNYDINIGSPQLKFLSLSVGELIAETLVAQDVLATIGGRVMVAPTTLLTADLSNVATTMTVKHNNLADGDRVYLQASPGGIPQVEFIAITSAPSGSAGAYTYFIFRNLDGTGANNWYAGDAILNTGTAGEGFIDLYSTSGIISGSGPTIVGNVRQSFVFNDIAPRWAIGNLNGLYNYAAEIYGAAFGDPNTINVTIDASNGFRIRSGTTDRFAADTAGNLTMSGDLTIGPTGIMRSGGASGIMTGSGFYIAGGSSAQFRIGNPANNYVLFDNAGVLTVRGQLNADDITAGSISGNRISGGTISGVTISAASGNVVLDANGIQILSGTNAWNSYKFSNGASLNANSTITWWVPTNTAPGTNWLVLNGNAIYSSSGGGNRLDLGTTSSLERFNDLYLNGNATIGGLSGVGSRAVCANATGVLTIC